MLSALLRLPSEPGANVLALIVVRRFRHWCSTRMLGNLVIRSRADSPGLTKAARAIEQAAWNELGYLNYTRAHYEHYPELLDIYSDYQLCLVDEETDYPVAVANCVPFVCSSSDDLPPEGWDWVVETAAHSRGGHVNMLGALAISVPAVHRSKGYARLMIRCLIDLAAAQGAARFGGTGPSLGQGAPSVGADPGVHQLDRRKRPRL